MKPSRIFRNLFLMLQIAKYVPLFFFRRIMLKVSKNRKFNLIIVDMDGTLTRLHTFKQALEISFSRKGGEVYQDIIYTTKNENNPFTTDNFRMLNGLNALVKGKFNISSERKLCNIALKQVNKKLADCLKDKKSKEVIIISRSSALVANYLAKKLGLSGGYGSVMEYDKQGDVKGAKILVTDKEANWNDKGLFKTKISIARDHMKSKKKPFGPKETILVSNDILDINTMAKVGLSVILKENNSDFINQLCYKLGLFDILIKDDYRRLRELLKTN